MSKVREHKANSAKINKKVRIEVKDIELGRDVVISDECVIEGKTAYIGPHTLIAAGAFIQANHIFLRYGSMIGEKSVISGWGGQLRNVKLGAFLRIRSNTNNDQLEVVCHAIRRGLA